MGVLQQVWRDATVVLAAICCLICVAIAGNVAPAHQRKVLKNPAPVYPQLAREQGLKGTVRIEITINAAGSIKSTRVLGGHPVLIQAAEQALKNWKFEPGPESTLVLEFRFGGE
ncbi:MAG TPA: energy transducer TonB [Terriglobales bacterium]|nr:energy transducer TonB [Terriglobales bacterium]